MVVEITTWCTSTVLLCVLILHKHCTIFMLPTHGHNFHCSHPEIVPCEVWCVLLKVSDRNLLCFDAVHWQGYYTVCAIAPQEQTNHLLVTFVVQPLLVHDQL